MSIVKFERWWFKYVEYIEISKSREVEKNILKREEIFNYEQKTIFSKTIRGIKTFKDC